MAEFDEKLNAILSDQEAMGQIMALARSLSGEKEPDPPPSEAAAPAKKQEASSGGSPDLSQLLGSVDPKLLQTGLHVLQEVQGKDDRNTQLLLALRPFLREERQAGLDRALQLSRMIRLVRAAIGAASGKGDEEDV